MKNLEVGTKVDFYEVVSYKNGVYTLSDGYNTVTVDMELNKIAFVERNNRCYKAEKFTKSFRFLINSIRELEEAQEAEEVEEAENLTDDLFQESDIAYATEAIERETCDLQDKIVNIDESSIGRVVGMRAGKYRIVMSTGKLVELNRNEFYLDNEEPNNQDEEAIERETNEKVKINASYEVYEETGYNSAEIKRQIVRHLLQPGEKFIPNEYKIVTLQNGERVEIFPFFTINNQLIVNVKYW